MASQQPAARKMTLDEFKKSPAPHGTDAMLDKFRGGTFWECHTAIYAATGIWIEELVPVFSKLDAHLITRKLGPQ